MTPPPAEQLRWSPHILPLRKPLNAAVREVKPTPYALRLEHVSHGYGGKPAVVDVSLAIDEGEIVCLVGPSGCGKSTLLRIAAGLERLQAGSVQIGGKIVADGRANLAPERRGVGLVFQDYALFPHLSVLDNVRFGLHRLGWAAQRIHALETLERVGMTEFASAFPHQLSGGQQQRVALARALAPKPRVLLLDEPFSGLDVQLRSQVRDRTLHVLQESGAATMIVTHDPEEAMFLADRIALMQAGRIVQVGAPADLYLRPISAFAAGFFGEVNSLPGVVRDGCVETPLGVMRGIDMADGQPVDLLIRPEALTLSLSAGGPGGTMARVEAARLLGRTSLVHLQLDDGKGGALHLHSRVPGRFLPSEGSELFVGFDPAQAFVFPCKGPH